MKKNIKYWAFQYIGWGLFAWLNIYIGYLTSQYSLLDIIVNIILSAFGVFITHYYRAYFLLGQWQGFTSTKILKHVSIAVPALSSIYTLFYFALLFIVKHPLFDIISVASVFGCFISCAVIFTLWNAIYFFWSYIEHTRNLQLEKLDLVTQKKDLEIKTIKANLQPHFIFNALNSIRALIHENPELARTSITQLANILRNSISNETSLIPLEKELDVVNDYLSLEKIRFEERLHISMNISTDTLKLEVPSMMIQTLVENAIKHGISNLEKGGELHIESLIENNFLKIVIANTGTLNTLNNKPGLGFGLSSSKQRLQLLYNDKASLTLTEHHDVVLATILIPISIKK